MRPNWLVIVLLSFFMAEIANENHDGLPNDDSRPQTAFGITSCDRRSCVTCSSRLCYDNFYTNFTTNTTYNIDFNGSCKTRNCVYIIKCTHTDCKYQYIGHTINTIASRISQHKSTVKLGGGCKVLKDHFTKIHSIENITIMPIKLLPAGNLTLKERESFEEDYMLKVNTVFPYGLNVRVKKKNILDACNTIMESKSTIYSLFDIVKIERNARGGKRLNTSLDGNRGFDKDTFFDTLLDDDNMLNMYELRTRICNLKKKELKTVYIHAVSYLHEFSNTITTAKFHKILFIKDLSWFYLTRMGLGSKPKSNCNTFLVVNYVNKFVEYIDFRKIFRIDSIKKAAPFNSKNHLQPTISYKYPPTIRSKVLNYRKAYEENVESNTMQCNCLNSQFTDTHHKHIITGDLSIITNDKLRNILMKGLNYRDQVKPCHKKARLSVQNALKKYCEKLSKLWRKPIEEFQEWKTLVMEQVNLQLNGTKPYQYFSVLNDPLVLQDLEKLHNEYVLVPTDKAKNNITVVCKKFYISMIERELLSSNFVKVNCTYESIIEEHKEFLFKHHIKFDKNNNNLPILYITPKQHKTPVGLRYITAGSSCSLQQLSTYLSICLKSMLHSAKNRSIYDNKFHVRNDYFVIDNNEPVLNFINQDNIQNGLKSVSTFDFSTLYTSIPHIQLKDNLKNFVERVFSFKEKSYIIPNLYTKKAYFSNAFSASKVMFSKDTLLECIDYLIDNSFIVYQGEIYRQVIGIPMGTNAAPQIANIHLHVYEFEYIKCLIDKDDKTNLNKLKDIFRYQDDLIVFNDFGLLQKKLVEIYPKEMVVNNTNVTNCNCYYLDLNIVIDQSKFKVSKYDKRNDYNFNVISYPFLDGNVPNNFSYGVFVSQLVRIAQINTYFNDFRTSISDLISKLLNQGFQKAALRKKFVKFSKQYLNLWGKYGVDIFFECISLFD